MSHRDTILQRVRERLRSAGTFRDAFAPPALPPAAEVWPRLAPDRGVMAERFAAELKTLFGEAWRLRAVEEAQRQLPALVDQEQWPHLGILDTPALRAIAAEVPSARVAWVDATWTAEQVAELPAGLIAAEALLADTGSCVVNCRQSHERWMCYLPPVCLVAARSEQLVEHLPALWEKLGGELADPAARGETVIITGPSRTSDIEKTLVLGAHGPKRLIVMLMG